MSDRGVLVFAYDGSFEGLMSAVFDAFSIKTTRQYAIKERTLSFLILFLTIMLYLK